MAHSRPWFEALGRFAQQQLGGRTLVLSGEQGLYYAGLAYPPVQSLLELGLHLLAVEHYQQIDIFSGMADGSTYLPRWQLNRGVVGGNYLGWHFRQPQQAQQKTATANALPSDDDIFGDSWQSAGKSDSKVTYELLPQFPCRPWADRCRLLFQHIESLCGMQWQGESFSKASAKAAGPSLIILDESYLRPDLEEAQNFLQNPAAGESQIYQRLAFRFQALPEHLKQNPVDLVMLGHGPDFAQRLFSGQWLTLTLQEMLQHHVGSPERLEGLIKGRVKPFQWSSSACQQIEVPALDSARPYGEMFAAQTQANQSWLQVVRQIPVAPIRYSTWDELEALTGLQAVKQAIHKLHNRLKVAQAKARHQGHHRAVSAGHFVFYGNPGTGKTTVARLLGRILKEIGVLPSDRVVNAERGQLVAGYVGQTAIQTNQMIDQAMGGILFIDEAYTLAPDGHGGQDYGKEAIDTLLTRMENQRGQFVVIAAGYRQEMQAFIHSNPGLESRFDNFLDFEDYQSAELEQIFGHFLRANQLVLDNDPAVAPFLQQHFEQMYRQRNANFANAREVRKYCDRVIECQAERLTREMGDTLTQMGEQESQLLYLVTLSDLQGG